MRKGGKKGKPEHRGVTSRAIKDLFVFVPWTLEERRVLSRSIKNLHWPNLAMTRVCNVVCLSGWARKEYNQ